MNVISARKMTEQELNNFFKSIRSSANNKKNNSIKWCADNEKKIVGNHQDYMSFLKNVEYHQYLSRMKKTKEYQDERIKSHNEHVDYVNELAGDLSNGVILQCPCGNNGTMKRLKTDKYDFIGCSNFRSNNCENVTYNFYKKLDAVTVDILNFDSWFSQLNLKHTYLSKIKRHNNYPKYVRPSDIFRTLKLNGVKFYCNITEDNFSNGVKASRQSNHEELALLERLNNIKGLKVLYQQGFYYETDTEPNKNKIAIPDYIICSKNKCVILDAKKSIDSCSNSQIEKYASILKKALKKPMDVECYHILFDRSNANADELNHYKVITINDLQDVFK